LTSNAAIYCSCIFNFTRSPILDLNEDLNKCHSLGVAHSALETALDAILATAHVATRQIDAVDFVLATYSTLHVSSLYVSATIKNNAISIIDNMIKILLIK
jgi:hypothetical protein